jgi:hypothetical protein
MKRSRRSRSRRSAPSKSPSWITVTTYVVALAIVLFFHNELGETSAGCFGAGSSPPSTEEVEPEPPAAQEPTTPVIQVRSEESERKEGLDSEDGIVDDPIQ